MEFDITKATDAELATLHTEAKAQLAAVEAERERRKRKAAENAKCRPIRICDDESDQYETWLGPRYGDNYIEVINANAILAGHDPDHLARVLSYAPCMAKVAELAVGGIYDCGFVWADALAWCANRINERQTTEDQDAAARAAGFMD